MDLLENYKDVLISLLKENDLDTIKRALDAVQEPKLIVDLREAGFNTSQIVKLLRVQSGTCHYCYDAPEGCRCWDDT